MEWEHLNDGMLGKECRIENCVLCICTMVLILFETNKPPSSAAPQSGGFGQIFESLRRPISSTLKVRGEDLPGGPVVKTPRFPT